MFQSDRPCARKKYHNEQAIRLSNYYIAVNL